MSTELRAYGEIVDFIAAGPSSAQVASFQPSETTRQHVFELLAREKSNGLSPEETLELDHYLQIEHLMRLAKARARQRLARMSNVDNDRPGIVFRRTRSAAFSPLFQKLHLLS